MNYIKFGSHALGFCKLCGRETVLKNFDNDWLEEYWLCNSCYEKEKRDADEQYKKEQEEYERYMFEHDELCFRYEFAKELFDAIGSLEEE